MATSIRQASAVRRLLGIGAAAAILALCVASPAAAQQIDGGSSDAACRFTGFTPSSVDPNSAPYDLQVDGVAPADATVSVYVNGVKQASGPATGGQFSFMVTLEHHSDIVTANYVTAAGNAYVTGCQGTIVDPSDVTRVNTAGVTAVRGALAFTGSSNTTTHVLIAVAAVVLGGLLVIGAGRRREVHADR